MFEKYNLQTANCHLWSIYGQLTLCHLLVGILFQLQEILDNFPQQSKLHLVCVISAHPPILFPLGSIWQYLRRFTKPTKIMKIIPPPLAPMGVLTPGSAHARPSAQPPIDTSGNFSAHMSGGGEIV